MNYQSLLWDWLGYVSSGMLAVSSLYRYGSDTVNLMQCEAICSSKFISVYKMSVIYEFCFSLEHSWLLRICHIYPPSPEKHIHYIRAFHVLPHIVSRKLPFPWLGNLTNLDMQVLFLSVAMFKWLRGLTAGQSTNSILLRLGTHYLCQSISHSGRI